MLDIKASRVNAETEGTETTELVLEAAEGEKSKWAKAEKHTDSAEDA